MMVENNSVQLITPATTPGSVTEEDHFLTAQNTKKNSTNQYQTSTKINWSTTLRNLVPVYMLIISTVQIICFNCTNTTITNDLRFEPSKRHEPWRYLTYMLLHWSRTHLVLNIIVQLLIASTLEKEQNGIYVVLVYTGGGLFGACGACLLQPQPVIGASAGIYAVLLSHLSHLYLNFDTLKYRKYRVFSVCVLAISDISFYAVHSGMSGYPTISFAAHASGAIIGVLLGLIVYKQRTNHSPENKHKTYIKLSAAFTIFILSCICYILIIVLPQEYFTR